MAKTTVGASAVSLTGGTATPAKYGTQLKADDDNTGSIYVGYASNVAADATAAMRLEAGQAYFVPARKAGDSKNIYVIASGAGQGVWYDPIN